MGASQSTELAATEPETRRALGDLGYFSFLAMKIPIAALENHKEWIIPVTFLTGIGATVLIVLKLVVLKKGGVSKFITTILVAIAAFIHGVSSTQTTAIAYEADSSSATLVQFLTKNKTANITRFAAAIGNAVVVVLALIGYNIYVTYILAVASFAATSFGNWEPAIRKFICDKVTTSVPDFMGGCA